MANATKVVAVVLVAIFAIYFTCALIAPATPETTIQHILCLVARHGIWVFLANLAALAVLLILRRQSAAATP